MSITVVATIYPIPEHRAEVIAALEQTIAAVHDHDDGCELHALQEGEHRAGRGARRGRVGARQ